QRTLFSIECVNGISVVKHSYFKYAESEIILMPGSYFEVLGQLNPAPELHIIELKEITPPMTLIKPPFSKSDDRKVSPITGKASYSSPSAPASLLRVGINSSNSASSKTTSMTLGMNYMF
ncbi:unnamed protein product, partial [Rotaria magnacalcarata]